MCEACMRTCGGAYNSLCCTWLWCARRCTCSATGERHRRCRLPWVVACFSSHSTMQRIVSLPEFTPIPTIPTLPHDIPCYPLLCLQVTDFRINPAGPTVGRPMSAEPTTKWRERSLSFSSAFNGTMDKFHGRRKSAPAHRIGNDEQPTVWNTVVHMFRSIGPILRPSRASRLSSTAAATADKQTAQGFTTRAVKVFNPEAGRMGLDIIPYGCGSDTGAVIISVARGSPALTSPLVRAGQVRVANACMGRVKRGWW